MAVLTATLVPPAPPFEFITVKMRARPEEVRTLPRVAVNRVNASIRDFRGGALFQKFARAGPHRGHDGGRMAHFTDRKNGDVRGVRLNQFDGADGPLRIVRINIDDHYFCPHVLYLAQHRVRGAGREPYVTEDVAAHSGSFQTMLEDRQPFSVFGQKSYRYTLHGFTLFLPSVCY